MARYRLPEALGGGECIFYAKGYAPGCVIVELVDVAPGLRVEIEEVALTEVKPPLPPEPPNGVVYIEGWGYWQKFSGFWEGTVSRKCNSWADVCALGTPVRLVPDPFAEPVEHPWERQIGTPYVYISGADHDGTVGFTVGPTLNTSDGYSLTAKEARVMARALETAADQAEAQS